MKKIFGVGALLTGSLLFAGDAQAAHRNRCCPCPCPPQPACPPAATAKVEGTTTYSPTYQPEGTTTYSPTYQPAEGARAVQPARPMQRAKTWEDYRREIKGW
jgi:hypothetical protein